MRILMFRHAERENTGKPNPPLSDRGLKQAVKLTEKIHAGIFPKPTRLYCSPKLRAIQTFQQVHLATQIELITHTDLDERKTSESMEQFEKRVQKFLHLVELQMGVVYFVTHLDWIEEAMARIQSDAGLSKEHFQSWLPGNSAEFEIHNGLWMFQKMNVLEP